MKVLIAGGIKTQNIVDGLEKKFISGGIDFLVVPYIDDIEDIFTRGEYYDRALIIEQCWNHDFEDTDEKSIRTRINEFAQNSANRQTKGVNYIFLAQTEDSAAKVYEEILQIKTDSIVVVKAPRYSVNFFASLVTCDIEQFPDNIVYKPTLESAVDIDRYPGAGEKPDRTKEPEIGYTPEEVDDISKELFDSEGVSAPGLEDFDKGVKVVRDEKVEIFDTGDDIWKDIFDDGAFSSGTDTPVEEEDIPVEDEVQAEEFEKSGDLPDFSQEMYTEPEIEDIPVDEEEDLFEEIPVEEEEDLFEEIPEEVEEVQEEEKIIEKPIVKAPVTPVIDDDLYKTDAPTGNGSNKTESATVAFNDDDYNEEGESTIVVPQTREKVNMSNDQVKATLDAFALRGNSIVVTGCGGCGTSTVAYNLANTIANIGYTVLLVDMDTEGRAQSYISKDNYNCMEPDGANLMAALNSTSGINAHVAIVRPGFRLLTMGLGGDVVPLDKMLQAHKLSRFINLAKTSHNFVIYDMPFKSAVGVASDIAYMADNLVVVADSSNWGITKTMLSICNIESEDMQDIMFSRGQLLYNKYSGFSKIMGKKVKSAMDISKVMDTQVREFLGEDPGYYFQAMHICGVINDDKDFEAGWFGDSQYSDSPKGQKIFIELLKNIVLKR